MRDIASARYVTVYTDAHGVKHIPPFSLTRRRGSAKQERMMKRNNTPNNFDKMPLDGQVVSELQYRRTANLENEHNELAKTPSTERKGVFENG